MGKKIKYNFLWLSIICLGIFLIQISNPGLTDKLLLNNRAINNYEYYRFFTSIFIHLTIVHLLYNLAALLFFGYILEKTIGSNKFLIVFLGSGIIANLIAVNFYPASLGASGAIYGVIGCIVILRPLMFTFSFGLLLPMFLAVIIWAIGDVIGIFNPSGVGNIAHLSGIGVGIFVGILIRVLNKDKKKKIIKNKIVFPENLIRNWEDNYLK